MDEKTDFNLQSAPHKQSVWVDKYNIPVMTDLKRPDEILYATETQVLGKPKTNYFAMMDFEEPVEETDDFSAEVNA